MPVSGMTIGFLRDRRQGPAPRPLLPPGGRDHAHAVRTLHGAHHVNASGDRPPAGAGLLHEGETLEPELLAERRRVAAEFAAVQLESKYPQPVAQAKQSDELEVPGR